MCLFLSEELAGNTPNLNTEIAQSLLDLSRKVEAQDEGRTTLRSLETEEDCQNGKSCISLVNNYSGPHIDCQNNEL